MPTWSWAALLALCVLAFYWTPLTSPTTGIQWDAADMHYPFQKYFSDHVRAGQLPFWTPYLFSGYPFLANPEVGAWYLPHWPFFLFGITPRSIQAELAVNTFLACLGAWLLIFRHVGDRPAAFVGALSYGLSGFFAGHSSHVGLFCAAAAFPWLLLAFRYAMDSSPWRFGALGGIAGGLMILAGYPQTAMYGFVAAALYALADVYRTPHRWPRIASVLLGMLLLALAVAAIQILPGLEATVHSVRASANYSQSTSSILNLGGLATLVRPDALGAVSGNYTGPWDRTQHYFYAGLLLLPLAAVGVMGSCVRVSALALVVPTSWYMLGPSAGLYQLGAWIPVLHKVRAPVQGWFTVALGLALLAAAGAAWIFRRWSICPVRITVIAVLFADLWYWNSWVNPLAYARTSFAEGYGAREEVTQHMIASQLPALTRFDAPRRLGAFGPLDHPLNLKMEATYGYFSLEPAAYNQYTYAIDQNPKLREELNVSLRFDAQQHRIVRSPSLLPRASFPKQVETVTSTGESRRALTLLDPSAKSIVLAPHAPIQQDPEAMVSIVSYDEQGYRMQYRAASPSLLRVSTAWFPGWRAKADGKDCPVVRVDHALLGVIVPAGSHDLELRFRSNYFGLGLMTSLCGMFGALLLAYRARGR
jgi:hypothetical protein